MKKDQLLKFVYLQNYNLEKKWKNTSIKTPSCSRNKSQVLSFIFFIMVLQYEDDHLTLFYLSSLITIFMRYNFIHLLHQQTDIIIDQATKMSEQKETVFNNIRPFVQKEVNNVINSHLTNKNYNVNDAQIWTNQICDDILKSITNVNKNFKFIANCIIMQKADCGLNISGSCFWDNEVDGTVTIKWDAPTLICIVNVFGCAL